jgi:hypothetical protein
MILEETINGRVFLEQRTFYIYESEELRRKGKWSACVSQQEVFNYYKNKELKKLSEGEYETRLVSGDVSDAINMNDSQISFIHENAGKWFYNFSDPEGLNRHSKLFDTKEEAIKERWQFFNMWYPHYIEYHMSTPAHSPIFYQDPENEAVRISESDTIQWFAEDVKYLRETIQRKNERIAELEKQLREKQ